MRWLVLAIVLAASPADAKPPPEAREAKPSPLAAESRQETKPSPLAARSRQETKPSPHAARSRQETKTADAKPAPDVASKTSSRAKSAAKAKAKAKAKARAKAKAKASKKAKKAKSASRSKSKSKSRPRSKKKWIGEWPADYATTPAYRYGSMTPTECEAELRARGIPYVAEAPRAGVLAPVRLTGPLHGVVYRTNLKEAQRKTTIWEIADCRLILALDDFAEILAAHDIVDVRHYSIHRSAGKDWPADKPATRHAGGLAIDAARFIKKDGAHLDVLDDFHGAIGDKTCGGDATAPHPATRAALELHAILCEAAAKRLFNVILTPNYNRPHRNHFHMEVTAGWKSFNTH